MSTPEPASGHRCPSCDGAHIERRTARNVLERAGVALAGYHPYRCLDCDRRFHDRPLQRPAAAKAADRAVDAGATPVLATRASSLAIGPDDLGGPRPRRRARWKVDAGDTPLARSEVYVLVLIGTFLALTMLVMLRLLWPETTGGVRVLD